MLNKNVLAHPQSSFKILKSRLIEKNWLTPTVVRLKFANHYLADNTHAGQFINIKVSNNYIPLLRRPFSIHRVNREQQWFEILFQVIGKGTELLANHEVGENLDLLGPLGNYFTIPQNCNHAVLIAGGLGIAPLLFLAQELTSQNIQVDLFFGNRSKQNFCCLQDFEALGVAYYLATEDGSLGFKGTVIDLLEARQENIRGEKIALYACGPNPMLQKVKEIANQSQLHCQISLETMMACGFGVCLGCVVNATSKFDPYKYVCKDGPVFNASEIDLSGQFNS
jgi:dihydroorotate dehydrogenase electron transfer subunit